MKIKTMCVVNFIFITQILANQWPRPATITLQNGKPISGLQDVFPNMKEFVVRVTIPDQLLLKVSISGGTGEADLFQKTYAELYGWSIYSGIKGNSEEFIVENPFGEYYFTILAQAGGYAGVTIKAELIPLAMPVIGNLLDTSFHFEDENYWISHLAFQSDGKIIVTDGNTIRRIDRNGRTDPSFQSSTISINDYNKVSTPIWIELNNLFIAPDNSITLTQTAMVWMDKILHITKLMKDGDIYNTFASRFQRVTPLIEPWNVRGVALTTINVTHHQRDGKILVGGQFNEIQEQVLNGIARLEKSGTLDKSFDPGKGVPYDSQVRAITLQDDGKILVGGEFPTFNGKNKTCIVRLMPNGQLDETFTTPLILETGHNYNPNIQKIVLDQDENIWISGWFNKVSGQNRLNVVKLQKDGSLSPVDIKLEIREYRYISGPYNGEVLIERSGDKIIIAGNFNYVNGIRRDSIARLSLNGDIDQSFDPGSGFKKLQVGEGDRRYYHQANISSIVAGGNDGSIIAIGDFTDFNGQKVRNVIKLRVPVLCMKDPVWIDGTFSIKVGETETGRIYHLEKRSSNGSWRIWRIVQSVEGNGSYLPLTDEDAKEQNGIYRVRAN